MRSLLLLAALVALGGCSTSIDADDYARNCGDASECVLISAGDVCDCSCGMSAINKADFERYQEDRSAIQCNKDCGVCAGGEVVCSAGICEAR
jgi:hypothetical protein